MKQVAAVVILMAAFVLAGCIQDPGVLQEQERVEAGLLFAPPLEAALWSDPQHFPHPAYNWPTLTHVPEDAPQWWQPIEKRDHPDPIEGIELLARSGVAGTGDGMAVFGKLAIAPGGSGPMEIYDISDPTDPVVLSQTDFDTGRREANIMAHPDGRLVAVLSTFSNSLLVVDITEPTEPKELSVIPLPTNSHTASQVPGTPIVYNANMAGSGMYSTLNMALGLGDSLTEIYDLTDPEDPVLVKKWEEAPGCHAISFHITGDMQRAYCAGTDVVEIWDVADPRDPVIISNIPFPHAQDPLPGTPYPPTLAHWVIVNEDASVMAVLDETGGGALAACDAYLHEAGHTVSGPNGNIWFYDITDETEPVLLSWLSPQSVFLDWAPSPDETHLGWCTAHLGQMIPDQERDLLAVGFYMAGVVLVDFTDPSTPFIVDQWVDEEGWFSMDVQYHQGYLFATGMGIQTLVLR